MVNKSFPVGHLIYISLTLPAGFKVSILLEELKEAYGMDYTYQSIEIFQGNVQKDPWFTKLGPNGRIPVLIDHDKGTYAIMETLAILNYLTRHYDPEHKFCFEDTLDICTAEQWMAWQQGGLGMYQNVRFQANHGNTRCRGSLLTATNNFHYEFIGPIQAQANFYYRFCDHRYAFPTQRFVGETERLYGVLDARLADRDYLAGSGNGKYSIADIAAWPFINASAVTGIELEKFPNVYKWWDRIYERPAVQKGLRIPSGKEFPFGYKTIVEKAKDDPEWNESESALKEALEAAQKKFGYTYKSP